MDPVPDGVEAVVEVLPHPLVEAEAVLPFLAHVVGRPEAPGVVDGGAAAQAEAGEQADALVGGRDAAASEVEPHEPVELRPVEVLLAEVTAGLDHDDIEALLGQDPGGGAAAGARADDDHVAVELGVLGDLEGLDRLRRRVLEAPVRTGVADRRVHRVLALALPGERVVQDHRQLAERLEGSALHDVLGVAPLEQELLAILLGAGGEAGIPAFDQPGEPVADVCARIASHRAEDHVGHVEVRRGRKPILPRDEGVADRVEAGPGTLTELDHRSLLLRGRRKRRRVKLSMPGTECRKVGEGRRRTRGAVASCERV